MEAPQQFNKQMNYKLTYDQSRSSGIKDRRLLSTGSGLKKGSSKSSVGEDESPEAVAKQSNSEASSGFYMRGRLMAEGAKQLSQEEMAALEIDIFKPLDFYEILINRMKGSDNGRIITNINEL